MKNFSQELQSFVHDCFGSISNDDLAAQLEFSVNTINGWLSGRTLPYPPRRKKLLQTVQKLMPHRDAQWVMKAEKGHSSTRDVSEDPTGYGGDAIRAVQAVQEHFAQHPHLKEIQKTVFRYFTGSIQQDPDKRKKICDNMIGDLKEAEICFAGEDVSIINDLKLGIVEGLVGYVPGVSRPPGITTPSPQEGGVTSQTPSIRVWGGRRALRKHH